MTIQPLTLVYSMSSAFFTISVYHLAKSSSMEVMASTIFLFSAILMTSLSAENNRTVRQYNIIYYFIKNFNLISQSSEAKIEFFSPSARFVRVR